MVMIETKLYLGLGRKKGPDVTKREIGMFLALCVNPRFEGYTLYDATGSWQGEREGTVVLEIIHDDLEINHNNSARRNIQNIARSYCLLFDQDCVPKVEREVRSELVGQ